MNASDYRNKSTEELKEELVALLQERFNLRMQKSNPQATPKQSAFKKVKLSIAQIKTILRQKGSKI